MGLQRSGWRGWLPSWGNSSSREEGLSLQEGKRSSRRARDVGAIADAAVAAVDEPATAAEPIDAVSHVPVAAGHPFALSRMVM